MNRSTDICTCGQSRDDHEMAGHPFFPHPQPTQAPQASFGTKLNNFLASQGEVRYSGASTFITELDGTVWEVQAFLRKERASTPKIQQ